MCVKLRRRVFVTCGKIPRSGFFSALRAVLAEHSICRAILRQDTPFARRRPILAGSTIFSGRPKRLPLARVFIKPAYQRVPYRTAASYRNVEVRSAQN